MDARGKQLCALGFCAFTVPAVLLLPGAGWLWAGLASLFSAVLLGILLRLKGERELLEAENGLSKGLLFCLLLWTFLALGAAARQLCAIFPTAEETPLVGLLLLLLAAYSSEKNRSLPVAAICFFFLLGLYGLLFGFSLPNLRGEFLRPHKPASWMALTAALLPLNLIYICKRKAKKPYLWLTGGVVFAVIAALVTMGSLSPGVALTTKFSFYEAAKSVTLIGSIQRLEPLVSVGLCLGGFCMLSLLCAVGQSVFFALRPQSKKLAGLINFFGGVLGFCLTGFLKGGIIAAGATIFWGFLPFLLLLVGKEKNIKNF